NISFSGGGMHVFNNAGLINRNLSTGFAYIYCPLNNTGTIAVDEGTLVLSSGSTLLDGGIYNVAADAVFRWENTVNLNGSLTGSILGIINWIGNVNVATTASLNFDGSGSIDWTSGTIAGGGILTNQFKIDLVGINN